MKKTFRLDEFGYEVELGIYARQADGAVWFKQGGTVVLATVVSATSKEFPGFLPLTVDYREQPSAAGKIPGGYFKREGKPTDKEVLTGRLIDRAMRPLFPANYFNQVQILPTVYSVDKEHSPEIPSVVAASLALTISKIPFMGPVGAVQVARVDGAWVYNPLYGQIVKSDTLLTIAGTEEGICMVEGCLNEVSEKELVEVLFTAHEYIKKQIAWQHEIARALDVQKEEIADNIGWNDWWKHVTQFLTQERIQKAFIADKLERRKVIGDLQDEFLAEHKTEISEKEIPAKLVDYIFDTYLNDQFTQLTLSLGKRIDGRSYEQVRPIQVAVGILPFTHGSAVFTRGQTQALASLTLGGGQDEQKVEELMGDTVEKSFMLHYNFPPFSVGEVRPMRGPGRREIGHGYLASSAITPMLPSKEAFPYTMRIVADMLESNGSTSMATVCASIMALMNAGVPIKKMVSGVAMGLLKSTEGKFCTLTDINGTEDGFGLMDFKVAGTDEGITAVQMDIKYKGGLPRQVFEQALEQAKKGRAHILGEMRKVMTQPNPTLSDLVPKVVSFKVPTDKIGAIIGSQGKVIKDIIEKTGTSIDIEDNGTVKIFGHPGTKLEQAVSWVKILGGLIEPGTIYPGIIRRVAEFGIFVELAPGQDGLVHVSLIPKDKQRSMSTDYPVDTPVKVQVMDYDQATGRIRLKFVN